MHQKQTTQTTAGSPCTTATTEDCSTAVERNQEGDHYSNQSQFNRKNAVRKEQRLNRSAGAHCAGEVAAESEYRHTNRGGNCNSLRQAMVPCGTTPCTYPCSACLMLGREPEHCPWPLFTLVLNRIVQRDITARSAPHLPRGSNSYSRKCAR